MQLKFYVFKGARRSGAVIGLPGAQQLGLVRFVDPRQSGRGLPSRKGNRTSPKNVSFFEEVK